MTCRFRVLLAELIGFASTNSHGTLLAVGFWLLGAAAKS